ncbi:MAG: GNAT family N-acetyltransferase [Pseudomonadales bacterium]|nr:GNAT family N-acetyltransferase [Pseudomonadales bacterium]
MKNNLEIREASAADYAAILVLNELALPHVNSIGIETLANLHAQSISLSVALLTNRVGAFLLALDETADYASLNYQWFKNKYQHFSYVDRIVVGDEYRRQGIAETLYTHLYKRIAKNCPKLTCEVNLIPENPGSIAFHTILGFKPVGEQESASKRVCLMAKDLDFE